MIDLSKSSPNWPNLKPEELDRRLSKLEELLRGKLDPKLLDKAKLTRLLASIEVDPQTYPTGELPNSGLVQPNSYMRDVGEHCNVVSASAQTFADSTPASVDMSTEIYDPVSSTGESMHDPLTNPHLVTLRRSGIYSVVADVSVEMTQDSTSSDPVWEATLLHNGSPLVFRERFYGNVVLVAPPALLERSDTLEVELMQTNNDAATREATAQMAVDRIGDITNDRPLTE